MFSESRNAASGTGHTRIQPRSWGGALRALTILVAVCAQSAHAERILRSLPHAESFDSSTYASDLVWITQGATHTWIPNGGWRGGAAKFTAPLAEGYSGLGQFLLSGLSQRPEQLNVRFLVYYGATWFDYGPGGKLVIMNRDGNSGRPMVIIRDWTDSFGSWETWGACDGTVCRYQGGDYWPDGTDRLRIGDPPRGRERQWISVELEANTRTGMIRLYVDTQDGALQGLYVERYMDDTGTGGIWSHIDIIGGYMNSGSSRQDPENYFMIDELVVSSQRIGPPAGFVTGRQPSPPAGVSAR